MKVRFPLWLLALLAVALIVQVMVLQQGWTTNPFARLPLGDAEIYWNWAGDIADGNLQSDTPFLSAPLYPYFLGLLRWLGASLLGVYAVQALLHLATIALIADTGRRRFGPTTGVLAGFLYLLLLDPTYYVGRTVNVTLQLLTVAALLWQAVRILEQRTIRKQAFFGFILGLAVLANPSMLLAVPIFVAWIMWGAERDLAGGMLILILACAIIAPATWHNHRASGEFIPVSAQAGLTFYHGNAPGASGVYHPVPGVSANRAQQNRDAFYQAADATGEESWKGTSRYFFGEGIRFLMENPGEAIALEGRKFWWFFTGRGYGDLYIPALEKRQEFGSKLSFAPLALALFLPLAVLGLILLGRKGLRNALPELLLFGMPLLVVLLFWYSPRYRMPVAPVAILLAAHAISVALRGKEDEKPTSIQWRIAGGVLLSVGIITGSINATSGFDDPELMEPAFLFSVGDTLRNEDRLDEAEPYLKRAVDEGFDTFEGHYGYSQMLLRRGNQLWISEDGEEQARGLGLFGVAVTELKAALRHNPLHMEARENMANLVFWYWERQGATREDAISELEDSIDIAKQIADAGATARLQEKLQIVLAAPADALTPTDPGQ
ncbi:MAG: glycosyltransferase family 39 protein [Planctomycetes bacterium]|nr:glycosyltransferase family 39 protein [Planctomycetota bacterium]